jgi:mRNA-degrading endonuclease RelE of RelBE toxin-antitoxin system
MYQVTFSDQSMHELNHLDILVQMPIIEKFSSLTKEDLERGGEHLGRMERGGKTYYRLRAGEFRIYFEVQGDTLYSHFILHQHSLADFVFRFKLPYREETLVEQHQSFWKYLESLKK